MKICPKCKSKNVIYNPTPAEAAAGLLPQSYKCNNCNYHGYALDVEETMEISLRKFKMSDIDRIMEIFPDEKVTDPVGLTISPDPPSVTKKFEMKWLRDTIAQYKKKRPSKYNLAIVLDGDLIGSVGLQNINYGDENTEAGYWVGSDYWGRGYATKALELFLKEVDKKFNFKRIYGYAFTFNPASKRVMEKCGFKLEGIRRKVKKGKNKFYDDWQLARVR